MSFFHYFFRAAKPNYACSASVTGSGGWPTVCDLPDEQCVDRQLSLAAAAALGNLTAPGAGPGPFAYGNDIFLFFLG